MKANVFFRLGLLAFFVSMFLPVWSMAIANTFRGGEVLLIGWIGVFSLDPRWFCNLTVLFSSGCFNKRYKKKYPIYCLICALAGTTVILGPFGYSASGGTINSVKDLPLSWGGYLWVVSLWLFYFAAKLKKVEIESMQIAIKLNLNAEKPNL